MVKNSPVDAEDPLEKEMAIHSSILSCLKKTPQTEKSDVLQSMGWQSQTQLIN